MKMIRFGIDYWREHLKTKAKWAKVREEKEYKSKKMALANVSARFEREVDELLLEIMEKDENEFCQQFTEIWGVFRTEWPKIRMIACARVSGGRSLQLIQLTDDEINQVKEIANLEVNKILNKMRNQVA